MFYLTPRVRVQAVPLVCCIEIVLVSYTSEAGESKAVPRRRTGYSLRGIVDVHLLQRANQIRRSHEEGRLPTLARRQTITCVRHIRFSTGIRGARRLRLHEVISSGCMGRNREILSAIWITLHDLTTA